MTNYLLLVAVVFAVNLMPAFGPPSWAVLVYFRLRYEIPLVPLVAFGAVSAASGRMVLAYASRHFRDRLPRKRVENLDALRELGAARKRSSIAGLALFAISPVPSAQLFIAAGLTRVPIPPLTAAFFAGRVVSYAIYASAATLAAESIETIVSKGFGSPVSIMLQVLMIGAVVALVLVPWDRVARHLSARAA